MLYHGSNYIIEGDVLTPHVSFDYKPYVYATDDFAYAVVRCGKFDIEDIAIKEEYEGSRYPYTLVELRPNAFKDIFNVSGVVYFVDGKNFVEKDNEYVSEYGVPVINRVYIENVWNMMTNGPFANRYYLIPYEARDYYFKMKHIDLDAYMSRRYDRICKILSKRGGYNEIFM